MAYSNACRIRGSLASGRSIVLGRRADAVDVADVEGHALVAQRLRLQDATATASLLQRRRRPAADRESATWTSPERRLAARMLASVMIR